MPAPDRLKALLDRGRQSATPPAEDEPPVGSTPKGLFLRKFRAKPAGIPSPKPLPPDGKDATNEKAVGPHSLEQEPVGQGKERGVDTGAGYVTGKIAAKAPEPPKAPIDVPYKSRRKAWPLALLKQLHTDHGWDWLEWEPEALWEALGDPTPVVRDIILALRTLFKTEAFWEEFHIFLWVCQAFNGRPVDFRVIPDLEPAEIMYGVLCVEQIRGQKKVTLPNGSTIKGAVYSSEILATIAASFRVHGLTYVPPPVAGATSLLLEQCDASVRPLSAKAGEAWEAIRRGESPKADDSNLGVQVQKLRIVWEYVKELLDE